MSEWSVKQSKYIYNLDNYEYIDVSDDGKIFLILNDIKIPITTLSQMLEENKSYRLFMPALIEKQLLTFRERLNSEFDTPVDESLHFPLKANRNPQLLEFVLSLGLGLEVGSKPELKYLLELGITPSSLVINGYKSDDFLELINQLDENESQIWLVIDHLKEIERIEEITTLEEFKILLRLRPLNSVKLPKFGLTVGQIEQLLRSCSAEIRSRIVGLHIHPSNLPDNEIDWNIYFQHIKQYLDHLSDSIDIQVLNLGGGLHRDNDSTNANNCYFTALHRNLDEYLEELTLIFEHGTYLVQHAELILAAIIDYDNPRTPNIQSTDDQLTVDLIDEDDLINLDPSLFDTKQTKQYFEKLHKYRRHYLKPDFEGNSFSDSLHQLLFGPQYGVIVSFSIFSELIDVLISDMEFHIIPTVGLDTQPSSTFTIFDPTCDSEGRYDKFRIRNGDRLTTKDYIPIVQPEPTITHGIPLPDTCLEQGRILIPKVGAYQKSLEADHNLFENITTYTVLTEETGWTIIQQ